ncbi:MAG TPA: Coenzyme F420 hydrogenase/dehydrogenase, beta subunit C-terminal domain [Sedimentisphaerales bacterium]|nr:Coenzyme F420 hydrogenase/dehydrogenase, beta subunit C-terminal domain [Sedimentisphaerales bacterium]
MKYTKELSTKYIGQVEHAAMAYSTNAQIRAGAASGGVVTAILIHLLETSQIDAAVVTRIKYGKNIDCEVILAKTKEEILSARTSKYIDVPVAKEAARLIKEFPGKVAVVTLPCHATVLKKLAQRDPQLAEKIKFIIALFCGHSSQRYLLDAVLEKKGINQEKIVDFAFRRGHWRGQMQGQLNDGSEFAFPFTDFSVYHNLNFFCLGRCLRCHDHTGYDADFCAGDVWLKEMKDDPIKNTAIFVRNPEASKVLDEMVQQEKLISRDIETKTIFRAQKRSFIYHYNVTARSRVGKLYGVKIKDTVKTKVRWNDWLAANIIMINYKLSQGEKTRRWIMKIPRSIIQIYFLFLKFLQNF